MAYGDPYQPGPSDNTMNSMDWIQQNPLAMNPAFGQSASLYNPPAPMPAQQSSMNMNQPTNYMSMIQQMISPYQSIANRMYSPYATGLGQALSANHPRLAGILDNALLTGSMVRPSMTPGEGISNVMGAMVGANQFQRERMLQSMMLPYQMAEPAVNMASKFAQMQHEATMNDYYTAAMIPYRQSQMGLNDVHAANINNPMMKMTGGVFLGNDGNQYQRRADGLVLDLQGNPMPRGVSITPIPTSGSGNMSQLTMTRQMLLASDPSLVNDPARLDALTLQRYNQDIGNRIGFGAGASQAAKLPQEDVTSDEKAARAAFQEPFKAMPPLQYEKSILDTGDMKKYKAYIADPNAYNNYSQSIAQKNTQARNAYNANVDSWKSIARKNPSIKWDPNVNWSAMSNGPIAGGGQQSSANPYRQQ